jgi:ParB-like chromosome segregation protein Spo0J
MRAPILSARSIQIRASIEAFGFTNPVLADPEGHIIAGHGRLQAARAMGLAELPVITLSGLSPH